MLEADNIEEIALFKEALQRPIDASDSDEDFIADATTNRGNKLKRDSKQISQGKLTSAPFEGHGVKVIEYMGHKRAVIYKKRKTIYQESTNGDINSDEEYDEEHNIDEDDPYEDIKLDDLLAPIEKPQQVATHPAISKTFTSTTLDYMSSRALEIICQEQEHVVKLAKLMSAFLGDDPSYLLANKLNLPQYTNEGEEEEDFSKSSREESNGKLDNKSSTPNGTPTNGNNIVKTEDLSSDKRITRNQTTHEVDPFFALPQINIDQNFGILPENAEETRQLTQIAQQRMEEFIRSMVNVRSGLLRADRYREKVYLWCKKMNGGDELPDYIAKDPAMKTKKPDPTEGIIAVELAEEKAIQEAEAKAQSIGGGSIASK